MFSWLKKLVGGADGEPKPVDGEAGGSGDGSSFSCPKEADLVLPAKVQEMVDLLGPQEAYAKLVQDFVSGLNQERAAFCFSDYYEGKCSKKDILDKYEELVFVSSDTIAGIIGLGEHHQAELLANNLASDSFSIYKEDFVKDIIESLVKGALTEKQVRSKLWSEYFNFVKTFLDTGKKLGINIIKEEPRDEIEATLIKLLEAEKKEK